jgi:RHS repeat-associated protein
MYTHGDQVGTNVLATAVGPEPGAATRAGRNMFTAFGQRVASVVAAGEPSAVSSRYGYVGAFGYEGLDANQPAGFDVLAEAGLLHVGARHYDPATGMFVERDPIGIRGGLNVYVYAHHRPLRRVDPTGWTWVSDVGQVLDDAGTYGAGITAVLALTGNEPGAVVMGAASALMIAGGRLATRVDQGAIDPFVQWYKRPAPPLPVTLLPPTQPDPIAEACIAWRQEPRQNWGHPVMDLRWSMFE